MLPKEYRLRAADFASPMRTVLKNEFFSIKLRKNTLKHNRFAVIVGTRVDRRAVTRNRLRRIFYDELSRWRAGGYDGMVIVASAAKQATRKDLHDRMRAAREALLLTSS